jgi:hypothetical protein
LAIPILGEHAEEFQLFGKESAHAGIHPPVATRRAIFQSFLGFGVNVIAPYPKGVVFAIGEGV